MRTSSIRCVAATLFVSILAATADGQSKLSILGTNLKNSTGDAWDVWTSPFRGRGDDWLLALGAVAGSAAVSLADASVDQWAVKQQNDATWSFLKPFREGGIAFSGRVLTPVAWQHSALVSSRVTAGCKKACSAAPPPTPRRARYALGSSIRFLARTRPGQLA
jgi:hypothetical protein